MARMMDSLILDNFPPYTLTKITTSTHRQPPLRQSTVAAKSKLPAGGLPSTAPAAGFSGASSSAGAAAAAAGGGVGSFGGGAASLSMAAGRPNHIALQARTRIPMQGKR